MKVGLTLPSFVDDPELPIAIARAAEAADLDGVFIYDHLWRDAPPPRRPALECFSLLGAVAAETTRIAVGTLVARSSLRPAATLAAAFDTADRVSNGRLIAAIGAGDSQSQPENDAFGLPFDALDARVAALDAAVRSVHGHGYPVWVGGRARHVRDVVGRADGWNTWGTTPDEFTEQAAIVRAVAPHAELTWGGLARPIDEGVDGLAGRLAAYGERGAAWVIVGPVDAGDPANPDLLGRVRSALQ